MAKKVHSETKPLKKEKRVKRERPNTNPPGPSHFPIPTGHAKPFVKSPQHAKWPAMFKKHLGVIEAHIRVLDRVMQSMHAAMKEMEDEERGKWERGEAGMWKTISEMMGRAKGTLVDARTAAVGILPSRALKEKKSLGTFGSSGVNINEMPGAYVAPEEKEGEDSSGSESDSGSEDSDSEASGDDSDGSAEEKVEAAKAMSAPKGKSEATFVPLNIGKKRKIEIAPAPGQLDENGDTVMSDGADEDAHPLFTLDTEPSRVDLDAPPPVAKRPRKEIREEANWIKKEASKLKKEAKLKRKAERAEEENAKRLKAEAAAEKTEVRIEVRTEGKPEVDFAAVQEELAAAIARSDAAAKARKEKKEERKRKRISDGLGQEIVVKKSRTESEEVKEESKEERKERKRKASAGEGEVEKKKRKHKGEVEA